MQSMSLCKISFHVIPWQHKFLQNFCNMREIVFFIFLIFLIPCRLNNPKPYHNPRPPTCSILYICPILWLPVHFHKNQGKQIDSMTTLFLPPRYGIISTYDIQRREDLCTILTKISNKFFTKFPPISLMARTITFHILLMIPSNMHSYNIKNVPIHSGLAKIRSRAVL